MKKSIASIIALSGILFSVLMLITGCRKVLPDNYADAASQTIDTTQLTDTLPPDELVVWRKPGRSNEEYLKWRDSVSKLGEVIEKNPCGSCDNSLLLLKGKGIRTYISTGGTVSGTTSSGTATNASGEDGPMYVSRNYFVTFSNPRNSLTNATYRSSARTYTGSTVKVAVFDTGVEPVVLNDFKYNSLWPSCIPGAENGWNFIKQGANYSDDNNLKHGTVVTSLMVNQVVKYGGNRVEILPVKTHNRNGVSDLSRVLCALAYAKERGVHIINASFGLYLPRNFARDRDSLNANARLFREFVRHYLTKNNILLVAAAGNKDDVNQKAAFDLEHLPYPGDRRDLSNIYFLPASLAELESFPNVIAVTTVHKSSKTVSPYQNYSPNTIDIGVNADAVIPDRISGDHYVFNHPLLDSTETVEGSSFAAPIVTGILCANYDRFKNVLNRANYKKEDIWNALSQVVATDSALMSKIKDGRYVRN